MHWNNSFAPKKQQYGWNTTSDNYHSHISKIERMPSVLNEAPHYHNVQKAFNNNIVLMEIKNMKALNMFCITRRNLHQRQKAQKKFQVTERVEIVQSAKDGDDKNYEVCEDIIDIQADGFIQRKHKGFDSANGRPLNCIRLL